MQKNKFDLQLTLELFLRNSWVYQKKNFSSLRCFTLFSLQKERKNGESLEKYSWPLFNRKKVPP